MRCAPARRAPARSVIERLRVSFRMPGRDDPAPRSARMVGMSAWAAALGLSGLAVGAHAMAAIVTGSAPGWFEPVVVPTGLLGITLTAAAFLAVHRRLLPWLLLGAGAVALVAVVLLSLL